MALTIWVRAALAVFRLTCDVVARWIEYCVLNASIKVRSCTFEFTAIVIERRVYSQKFLVLFSLVMSETYLDDFELDLVVTVFGAAANCLDDCIDQQARPLAVKSGRLLPTFVLAVVSAVSVKEVVAEQFLDPVKQLFDEARLLALNRHLKDVEVLVCAELFVVLVYFNLL